MPVFDISDDAQGGDKLSINPGTYSFVVSEVEERSKERGNEFRSGNEGVSLQLSVAALPDRDITVFEHLVNTKPALWKVREFCRSIGISGTTIDSREFRGRKGLAKFAIGEKGFLVTEKYLPQGEVPKTESTAEKNNVPF